MIRRPRAFTLLAPAAFALLVAGCAPRHDAVDRTDYGEVADDGMSSEADRTDEMQAMADDMNADLEDAMANAESEQDLERAYQEFEASRQELNEAAEADRYAPEP